jgi:hypothetical protein
VNVFREFANLHFREGQKNVFLAREIVKERAFADVGGIGDVFYGGLRKTFLVKKSESRAKQALANLSAAALSPAWRRRRRRRRRRDSRME